MDAGTHADAEQPEITEQQSVQVLPYAAARKPRRITAGSVGRFAIGFITLPVCLLPAAVLLGGVDGIAAICLAIVALAVSIAVVAGLWFINRSRSYLWGVLAFAVSPCGWFTGWLLLVQAHLIWFHI